MTNLKRPRFYTHGGKYIPLSHHTYIAAIYALMCVSASCLFPARAMAQQSYEVIQVKVIDYYENSFRNLLNNKNDQALQLNLVQVKTTREDSVSYAGGLSIRVISTEVSKTISSTGIALTGDLGLTVGRSKTDVVTTNKGEIFLNAEDIETLISFLNKTIKLGYGKEEQSFNTSWRLTFEQGLVWGVVYDNRGLKNWFYFVEINGARFEVAFQDGRDMLQMIARSRKWLEEDFPLREE